MKRSLMKKAKRGSDDDSTFSVKLHNLQAALNQVTSCLDAPSQGRECSKEVVAEAVHSAVSALNVVLSSNHPQFTSVSMHSDHSRHGTSRQRVDALNGMKNTLQQAIFDLTTETG